MGCVTEPPMAPVKQEAKPAATQAIDAQKTQKNEYKAELEARCKAGDTTGLSEGGVVEGKSGTLAVLYSINDDGGVFLVGKKNTKDGSSRYATGQVVGKGQSLVFFEPAISDSRMDKKSRNTDSDVVVYVCADQSGSPGKMSVVQANFGDLNLFAQARKGPTLEEKKANLKEVMTALNAQVKTAKDDKTRDKIITEYEAAQKELQNLGK
jgi:hypothetical protein